jgi:deoxyribose-phosphate aldolase
MSRDLSKHIDHTILKPDTRPEDVRKLCAEAREHGFATVFVPSCYIRLAATLLRKSGVKVGATVGFPLGWQTTRIKMAEAREAVKDGAREVDMVLNIGALKSGNYDLVKKDIRKVVRTVGKKTTVKVILEAGLLSEAEKVKACELAMAAGAHFVKTSTGTGYGGATVEDVKLLRRTVGTKLGVKASGGIRTYEQALALVEAGADRIGTSAGVQIVAGSAGSSA